MNHRRPTTPAAAALLAPGRPPEPRVAATVLVVLLFWALPATAGDPPEQPPAPATTAPPRVAPPRVAPPAAPPPATAPATPTFQSFLDSLRARSAGSLDRRGVEESWPRADSLESLVRAEGPAYADTAGTWRLPPQFHLAPRIDLVAFNRIEGLRLGAGVELRRGRARLRAGGAYGFSSEAWRHREELRIGTMIGSFTFTYADLVHAYGRRPIPGNDIFALIAGADDQDYLRRRGGTLAWERRREQRRFAIAFAVADELEVPPATDWNLLGRDRGPRPNPGIDGGRVHRLRLAAGDDLELQALGGAMVRWRAAAEIGGYGLGGDFDYDRYSARLEADLHLPGRDDLRVRVEAGGARNGPPAQSRFYLGGPLLLRAYPVHFAGGDRLLAGAFDYWVGTDLLGLVGLRSAEIQFIPFGEIGAVWRDANGRGAFSRPASRDWRSDAGLALQRNIMFGVSTRVDLAFRLDRNRDRFTWRFRFQTPLFNRLEQ